MKHAGVAQVCPATCPNKTDEISNGVILKRPGVFTARDMHIIPTGRVILGVLLCRGGPELPMVMINVTSLI